MNTKNPIACSARMTPYMPMTRQRSSGVMALNDCRSMLRMPGRAWGAIVPAVKGLTPQFTCGNTCHCSHRNPDAYMSQVLIYRNDPIGRHCEILATAYYLQ